MEKFIWTGPSWAYKSYDPLHVEEISGHTNLACEWNIAHYDLSKQGSNVLYQKNKILNSTKTLPIIWVYPEPLGVLEEFTGMTLPELLKRNDWYDIREECNDHCLKEINSIGRPVLLIGGHSDVINCDYQNIQVAHPSWQKFIASCAEFDIVDGIVRGSFDNGTEFKISNCWGAEIVHKALWKNPDITATKTIVDSLWDIFFFWKELERKELFYEVHPNKKSTVLFAEFLKPIVIDFLEKVK